MCTRPIWSWYSHAIKEIRHADHQVAKLVSLQREWVSERHLRRLAALPTSNLEELQVVLNMGISDTVPKVLELSQLLLKHRLWSLSKSAAPPDCYAGLLSADRDLQEAGWLLFISHWHFFGVFKYLYLIMYIYHWICCHCHCQAFLICHCQTVLCHWTVTVIWVIYIYIYVCVFVCHSVTQSLSLSTLGGPTTMLLFDYLLF